MKELKAHRIQRQIEELEDELENHQRKCKHKKVEKTAKSSTNTYDPDTNSYWYNCFCPTCLKRWMEDQ